MEKTKMSDCNSLKIGNAWQVGWGEGQIHQSEDNVYIMGMNIISFITIIWIFLASIPFFRKYILLIFIIYSS